MAKRSLLLVHICFFILGLSACQSSADEQPTSSSLAQSAELPEEVTEVVEQATKRNFILITADTMRGDVASIDGGPAYTPTMTKMRGRTGALTLYRSSISMTLGGCPGG